MANFKIVTQKSPKLDFLASDQTYSLEMESLNTVGAEIMEVDATSEDEFIKEARYADALIARGRRITKKIINELVILLLPEYKSLYFFINSSLFIGSFLLSIFLIFTIFLALRSINKLENISS